MRLLRRPVDDPSAAAGGAPGERRQGPAGTATGPADEAATGKGRPTPKRRDREVRRRVPVVAPTNRREAARLARQRRTQERTNQRRAIMAGDERALPRRDAGPVRRLARDVVDSRHTVGSFLMIVLVVVYLPSLVLGRSAQTLGELLVGLYFLLVLAEGYWLGRRARRLAAQRYPDLDRSGVAFYTAMRAAQLRRLRVPRPRVKVGDPI